MRPLCNKLWRRLAAQLCKLFGKMLEGACIRCSASRTAPDLKGDFDKTLKFGARVDLGHDLTTAAHT